MSDIYSSDIVPKSTEGDIHDELGVLPIPKILEIFEVVHECFILEELALSQNYVLEGMEGDLQLRY
jgi:hypothetical protein